MAGTCLWRSWRKSHSSGTRMRPPLRTSAIGLAAFLGQVLAAIADLAARS